MVDWLHCNLCFTQPGTGANFSLTNCGHIYCEKCLQEGCSHKCRMCGSKCTIIRLSAQMKPEVELFFTDPVDIFKKCLKQATQVMDFQKNHRRRLLSYFKDKISKQQEVLDKAHFSLSQYKYMEREVIKLREENSYLKKLVSERGLGMQPRASSTGSVSRPSTNSSPSSNRPSPNWSPSSTGSPYHMKSATTYQASSQQPVSSQCQSQAASPLSSGRISVRTPPSGGRIGGIHSTPMQDMYKSATPLSVPHPIALPSPSPSHNYL